MTTLATSEVVQDRHEGATGVSVERHKQIIQRVFDDGVNRGDHLVIEATFAERNQWYVSPSDVVPWPPAVLNQTLDQLRAILPDLTARVIRMVGRVYLAIGRCQRWPRRYRGQDIWAWFDQMGILNVVGRRHNLDPSAGCTAVLTGVRGGYDLDYDRFAATGITLLGHLEGSADGVLHFADDLQARLASWDASRTVVTSAIDAFIAQTGRDAPPDVVADDVALRPWRQRPSILEVDLKAAGISTILWATGFGHDFGWIEAPFLTERGDPIQQRGVSPAAGLYFLGLRRMYTVKSSFLFGVGEDAAFLAEHLATRSEAPSHQAVGTHRTSIGHA